MARIDKELGCTNSARLFLVFFFIVIILQTIYAYDEILEVLYNPRSKACNYIYRVIAFVY